MLPASLSPHSRRLISSGVACAFACVVAGGFGVALRAAERPVTGIVEKEIARRNARAQEAKVLMTQGESLYAKGEYEQAMYAYRQAWDLIPESPMTVQLKLLARDGYSRAAVAHARKLAAAGRAAEARVLLKSVLAEDFDPGNKQALVLQEELDDPDRYEPALTAQHVENVAKVERELRLGSSFMNLGDYNSAIARFHEVLRIDPYNQAARRNLERVEQFKSQYFDTARDHTRSKRLAEVEQGWEDPIASSDVAALFGGRPVGLGAIGGAKENILTKLRTIILPIVDLQGASLEEVVEFMRIRSRELDPQKRGVDFVLKVSPESSGRPVTMSMVGAPLEEVLRYATDLTSTVYRVDEFAITITSRAEKSDTLILKSYRVPPGFLENAPAGAPVAAAPAPDPFAATTPGAGTTGFTGLQIHRLGPREFLVQRGVVFPEGATATYVPSTNILTVRNTAENLSLIDSLVEDAASSAPKQVLIQVKMLEINETRLHELGFDWLVSKFNAPGSNRIFASGGTPGNQASLLPEDFPFGMGGPVGANPITSGLRSSGAILGMPSIEGLTGALRTPAVDSRSPGAFTVAGVFTDPQFQVVLRALSQRKGVDLMASPSVVTKAGQRATINIVREFIYPTEYDPPQIPQTVGSTTGGIGGVGGIGGGGSSGAFPVTPTTPTAFEMRPVGVRMEVEPVIGPDGYTIDLNLAPEVTEFEGFVNYGSPINTSSIDGFTGQTKQVELTPNNILQPIFRSNKVTTSVAIWDGNTVVLGGVMYETMQNIKDKVPIIGSIPLVGRAFQSSVSQRERKSVIFFVTVRVLDPGGNPINQTASGPVTAGP